MENWSVVCGLWEPELLLVGRGSNTYFMQKYDNTFIKFVQCCYAGFFCDILSHNAKMYQCMLAYIVSVYAGIHTYTLTDSCTYFLFSIGRLILLY